MRNFKSVNVMYVGTEREKMDEEEERETMYLCGVDSEELISACPARATSYKLGNAMVDCSAWWTEGEDEG